MDLDIKTSADESRTLKEPYYIAENSMIQLKIELNGKVMYGK